MRLYLSKRSRLIMGKQLASWRLVKGMSQRISDVRCNFSPNTTCKYECGEAQIPLDKFCLMARIYRKSQKRVLAFLIPLIEEDLRLSVEEEYKKEKARSRIWSKEYRKKMEIKWQKMKKLKDALDAMEKNSK